MSWDLEKGHIMAAMWSPGGRLYQACLSRWPQYADTVLFPPSTPHSRHKPHVRPQWLWRRDVGRAAADGESWPEQWLQTMLESLSQGLSHTKHSDHQFWWSVRHLAHLSLLTSTPEREQESYNRTFKRHLRLLLTSFSSNEKFRVIYSSAELRESEIIGKLDILALGSIIQQGNISDSIFSNSN